MPEIKIQRPQPYLGPSGRLKSRSRAHPTEGGGWLIFRPPLEASREPSWSVLGQFCAVSGRPKRLRCFLLTFPAIQHRTISVQLTALLSFRGGVDAAGVPLSLTRVLNFAHYVPEAHCFRYVRTYLRVHTCVRNKLVGRQRTCTYVSGASIAYVRTCVLVRPVRVRGWARGPGPLARSPGDEAPVPGLRAWGPPPFPPSPTASAPRPPPPRPGPLPRAPRHAESGRTNYLWRTQRSIRHMRKATRTAETVVRSNFGSSAAGSRLQARSVDVFRTDRQNNDGGTNAPALSSLILAIMRRCGAC